MNKDVQEKKSFSLFKKRLQNRKDENFDDDEVFNEQQDANNEYRSFSKVVFENGDTVSKDENIVINWTKTFDNLLLNKIKTIRNITRKALTKCLVYKAFDNAFKPEFSFELEFENDKNSLSIITTYKKDEKDFSIKHLIHDVNRKEFDFQAMLDYFYENNKTIEDVEEMDFDQFIEDELDSDYYVTIKERNVRNNTLEILLNAKRSFGVFKNNSYVFQNLKLDANFIKPKWSGLFLFLKNQNILLDDLNEEIIRQNLKFAYGRDDLDHLEYSLDLEKDYCNCVFTLTITPLNVFNDLLDNTFVCDKLKMSISSIVVDKDESMEEYLKSKDYKISIFNFDVEDFKKNLVYYFKDQKYINSQESIISGFEVKTNHLIYENYRTNVLKITVSNQNFIDANGQYYSKKFEIRNLKIDLDHVQFNLSSLATNLKLRNLNFFDVNEKELFDILKYTEITYENIPLDEEQTKLLLSIFKIEILDKSVNHNLFKMRIFVDQRSTMIGNFLNEYKPQVFISKDWTNMIIEDVSFDSESTSKEITLRAMNDNGYDDFVNNFVYEQIHARTKEITSFFKSCIKLDIQVKGHDQLVIEPSWLEIVNIGHRVDKYDKKVITLDYEVINLIKTNGQTLKFQLILKFNALIPNKPFLVAGFKELI